jgi:(p)ppGpp synthase/HD superfamily hydrolase
VATTLGTRFDEALQLAHALHRDQRRKLTGAPAIAHLLQVTALALEAGADEDTAIAALLHDSVEDAGGGPTRELIAERFGPRVERIVCEVTESRDDEPERPWRERTETYLAHVTAASPEALVVALADKVANCRSLVLDVRRADGSVWEALGAGPDGQVWWYESLVAAFEARSEAIPPGAAALLDELLGHLQALRAAVARGGGVTPGPG